MASHRTDLTHQCPDIAEVLGTLPENVRDIWYYGFTEMYNNALDHSGGNDIHVAITKTAVTTEMVIADDGVGIFRKIQKALNLLDERQAIFELSKGKLTTDPNHHTGQGIFFTSRILDAFDILSGGVFFTHAFGDAEDWLLERKNPNDGTAIFMRLGNHTARTTKKIFDQYTGDDPNDFGFNKTEVPVELAQYGNDKLISRSQAKRVLEHPQVELVPIHTNSEVKRMIMRAIADAPTSARTSPLPSEPDVSDDTTS